jgi:hypothetical protein
MSEHDLVGVGAILNSIANREIYKIDESDLLVALK